MPLRPPLLTCTLRPHFNQTIADRLVVPSVLPTTSAKAPRLHAGEMFPRGTEEDVHEG